ncbi:MAG: hypothetical protein KIT18_15070, partial [Burkholderiales bacterium]|nr:hypothetical protein [Burkholderiales bacterium]
HAKEFRSGSALKDMFQTRRHPRPSSLFLSHRSMLGLPLTPPNDEIDIWQALATLHRIERGTPLQQPLGICIRRRDAAGALTLMEIYADMQEFGAEWPWDDQFAAARVLVEALRRRVCSLGDEPYVEHYGREVYGAPAGNLTRYWQVLARSPFDPFFICRSADDEAVRLERIVTALAGWSNRDPRRLSRLTGWLNGEPIDLSAQFDTSDTLRLIVSRVVPSTWSAWIEASHDGQPKVRVAEGSS